MTQHQTASGTDLLGHRYKLLDKLGAGGMGTVYRALDRLSGQPVAVKRVHGNRPQRAHATKDAFAETLATPATGVAAVTAAGVATDPTAAKVAWGNDFSEEDLSAFRMALAREFRTLSSLRHPQIISVLDYGFDDQRQPYLVMELIQGSLPILETAATQPLPIRLRLLDQLLRALIYLHRRGILHRDLKPSNILLLRGADGLHLKVLDFGLALEHEQTDSANRTVAGTLGYLPPEVLMGGHATERSDLYALGVIAYQLISGHHPYSIQDDRSLVAAVLKHDPAREPLGPDDGLAAWVLRLLHRDPQQRFESAVQALQSLQAQRGEGVTTEPHEVRESYLQAARFVGREQELSALCSALEMATRGQGSTWLVAGESGVGKSRLLDELRTLALVRGMRVLRGQAEATAEAARMPFLEIVRGLLLDTPLDDEDASILKALVPDLPMLLEREVPDPPSLNPQMIQQQILRALVHLFVQSETPTLILLEDAQWAPAESVAVIRAAAVLSLSRPALIVTSYRDDERPNLPREVPGASVLKLHRFDRQTISDLGASMLGPAGAEPELVDFLAQETEGNAFFMVEVIRALAEKAGGLEAIGQQALPRSVLTRGVQQVIQRRLSRIPESAQPLLKLAAVAGRRIDRLVLGELEPRLEQWLQVCTEAAIFDVCDAEWQFAHDKLRERILSQLHSDEKQRLHLKIAQTMERVYGGEGPHIGVLGYHYDEAGEWAKAGTYLSLGGADALRRGGLQRATEMLERALQLQTQSGAAVLEKSATLRRLTRALYGAGRNEDVVRAIYQVMALLGQPIPETRAGRLGALLRECAIELRHRLVGARPLISHEERVLRQEQINVVFGSGDALFVGKGAGRGDVLLLLTLSALHAAEQLDDKRYQAMYFSSLGFAAYAATAKALGRFYMRKAEKIVESTPTPMASYHFYGGLLAYAEGRWQACETHMGHALRLTQRTQELGQIMLAHNILAALLYERGRLAEAKQHAAACEQHAIKQGNQQLKASGMGWRAMFRFSEGDAATAIVEMREALKEMEQGGSRIHTLTLHGGLSLCALRAGQLGPAKEYCDLALRSMKKSWVSAPVFLIGFTMMLEASLGIWEACRGTPEEPQAERRALRAVWEMSRFAFAFPIGKPWALLGLGRFLANKRSTRLAGLCLDAARRQAVKLDMRTAQERARVWLAEL